MKILCSGHLIRYPVGGFSWHHLQYLAGFQRLGHEVAYVEHFGWPNSCYDPARDVMGADPSYGLRYFRKLLEAADLSIAWCYLGEDDRAYGMDRAALAARCREAAVYFNLSNINWIPELASCRRRVLIDTDPVFTQIRAHGLGGPFEDYHARFTYGENVHHPDCSMPDGGVSWLPTRQPVVLSLWPRAEPREGGVLTSVMNWSAYGDHEYRGQTFGQKNREFEPYVDFPRRTGAAMELAVNAPDPVKQRLREGGWRLADPKDTTRTPATYQAYLAASRGEFSVAKHAYVCTRSGWFSDRSCGYLATGRPVILQDTGFSRFLPCGKGLLAFQDPGEASAALAALNADYPSHCQAAREIAAEYFDARRVLGDLLEKSLS